MAGGSLSQPTRNYHGLQGERAIQSKPGQEQEGICVRDCYKEVILAEWHKHTNLKNTKGGEETETERMIELRYQTLLCAWRCTGVHKNILGVWERGETVLPLLLHTLLNGQHSREHLTC